MKIVRANIFYRKGQTEDKSESIIKKGKSLAEYESEFYTLTGKASDLTRSLSLGGVAIIWIFKNTDPKAVSLLPEDLFFPLICIVISLTFDLLQYVFMGISVKIFHRHNEIKYSNGELTQDQADNLLYPSSLEITGWSLYGIKIFSMILGYVFMAKFLIWKFFGQ